MRDRVTGWIRVVPVWVWEVLAILAVIVLTRGETLVWPSTPVIDDGQHGGRQGTQVDRRTETR